MMEISISHVRTPDDIAVATELVLEFFDFLRNRVPHLNDDIDEYLVAQNFEEQLANLPAHFNPPHGECLVARMGDRPVGVLMMKRLDDRHAEMNRMYVRDEARGFGIARQLCVTLGERARELEYEAIVLSTLVPLHEAISLYRSIGFQDDPARLAEGGKDNPNVVCMRMTL